MAYGTVKVDTIIFDQGGTDQNVTASGIYRAITSGVTVTGTISGAVLIGTTTVSGATVTGTAVQGTTVQGVSGTFTSLTGTTTTGTTANFVSGVFTTRISGTTVTGDTGQFTSGNFVTLSGATATFTSGIIASGTAAAPSLAILGDPDTGVFSPDANQLAVATNGTGRLFVDASGNVGIGGSPNKLLELASFNDSSAEGNTLRFTDTDGSSSTNQQTGRIEFFTSDATQSGVQSFILGAADDFAGSGSLRFGTGLAGSAAERLRVTSAGLVGIGTTSPVATLHVANTAGGDLFYALGSNSDVFKISSDSSTINLDTRNTTGGLAFQIQGTERTRIDSSGRLLVGTSSARTVGSAGVLSQIESTSGDAGLSIVRNSNGNTGGGLTLAKSRGTSNGSSTIVQSGDDLGLVQFAGADGNDIASIAARIACQVDGTPGADDMPGRLVFSTTADGASTPTERMRIASNGSIFFAATSESSITSGAANGKFINSLAEMYSSRATTGAASHILFYNPNGYVGQISTTAAATSYATSSDYRLKENVTLLDGAIARLNQLPVHRFNFIADPDTVVDGFIAHEAAAVVPECVTGEKDEEDENGDPVYQGIDQSKVVPLLTAALQEAIAKIHALEARVAALEA
jgi:hypothetical protein